MQVNVFFTLLSMEFAADAALAACSDDFKSGVTITPRSFSLPVAVRVVPPSSKCVVWILGPKMHYLTLIFIKSEKPFFTPS